jgi:dTDP-4-amino-4,6-dideoxygalactose transaminase
MSIAVNAQVPGGEGARQAQGAARALWDLAQEARIPVSAPMMPKLEAALPHLRRIDEHRLPGEQGGLVAALEERLCAHYGLPSGSVAACVNATVGLTLALQAAASRPDGLCIVPAWTHAATAQAVLAAGFTPFVVDVDPESGALTPALAWRAMSEAPGPVAAVLPTAPFGRAPESEAWDEFHHRTDAAVVLDAAGGFDCVEAGSFPSVVSLRAGKPLAAGEGGFLVSWDAALILDIRRRANLGMGGRLEAAVAGANGRMGEPAAAYAHAALDLWRLRKVELAAVLDYYRAAFADLGAVRVGEGFVRATCCIEAPEAAILAIEARLAEAGIASRRWYGQGLRGHAAFADLPGLPTPVADELARRTLGLPCWAGLRPGDLEEIAGIVRQAIAEG